MGNPYAPRVQRAEAPGFPGGRFARLGANALQIAVGEWMWGQLDAEGRTEAAAYLASLPDEELGLELTDDELADPGDLTLEELMVVHEWATAEVDAGTYEDRDAALWALDDAVADLQPTDEEAPEDCQLCAELTDEVLAELPEHNPAAHVGNVILSAPLDGMLEDAKIMAAIEAGHEHWTPEWWATVLPEGVTVIATHEAPADAITGVVTPEGGPVDPANIPVGEQGAEQFVPGGPGTADGGAVAAPPAAPSPSGADQVLDEEATLRIGGSVDSLMEWVGDDLAKAGAVRRAEEAKPEDEQRKTLHERLAKLVGTPDAG